MPRRWVELNAEQAVAADFITQRRLFGDAYCRLQPDYFFSMPEASGVFVLPFAPVTAVSPSATRPGDIDLLILPYEGDELVLDRAMAIEVKVVRARFDRPGRSPNEFGFSQAEALLELGFPYVAVAHLIVSNESPEDAWEEMMGYQVLDQYGKVGEQFFQRIDTLPIQLINRAYGRLEKACKRAELGLTSAFVRYANPEVARRHAKSTWYAEGREAQRSPRASPDLMRAVGRLFATAPEIWFDNPRRG